MVEINSTIKNLKSGKAEDCNNIPPEAIKAGGEVSKGGSFGPLQPDMECWAGARGMEERSANQAAKER